MTRRPSAATISPSCSARWTTAVPCCKRARVRVLHEVAADGVSELLKVKINEMDEESFAQYLRFHFYTCEKPEHLGASNHWLFVGEK